MSNFNGAGASRFSGSTHANRGLGATSRGAGNATTISTGVVTDVVPQKTGAIHLVCQPSNNSPTVNGKVEVLLLLPQAYENGGTMMSPRVGDKIVWLTAGATSYYLGSAPQESAKPSFVGETSDDATFTVDAAPDAALLTKAAELRTEVFSPHLTTVGSRYLQTRRYEDELKEAKVKIKDMAAKEETLVDLARVVEELQARLPGAGARGAGKKIRYVSVCVY